MRKNNDLQNHAKNHVEEQARTDQEYILFVSKTAEHDKMVLDTESTVLFCLVLTITQ